MGGRPYSGGLTAEELKIREDLRERYKPQNQGHSQNDRSSFEPIPYSRKTTPVSSRRLEWGKELGSFVNRPKTTRTTPTENKVRNVSKESSLYTRAALNDEFDIAQAWGHVKRSTPQTETKSESFVTFDRGLESKTFQYRGLVAERARQEESRRARLEQTKDGKFVQLGTAVQHNALKSLEPQEKNVSWRSYSSPASQEAESLPNSLDSVWDGSKRWRDIPAPLHSNMAEAPSQNSFSPFVENRARKRSDISSQLGYDRNNSLMGNSSDTVKSFSPAHAPDVLKDTPILKKWIPLQDSPAEDHSPVPLETRSSSAKPSSRHRATRFGRKSRGHIFNSPYVRGSQSTLRHQNTRYKRRFIRRKSYEDDGDETSRIERKRKKIAQKLLRPPKQIYLPEFITVSNLATVLKVRVEDFGSKLRALGFEATNNDLILDAETAGLIAAELNFEPVVDTARSNDLVARPPAIDVSLLPARPPVVTIMGHVDHGKTTLLDWLRKSSVAASEHGGITQHIGAFSVSMPGGRLITFLDTPGHEAFLSMRQRGANVTDIVILVVAADDSVKPQTVEAIKHAKAAKVPIIVAVSKIDKQEANVERVKHDLARYGVEIEDFGGDTQVVCISGKTGQGMMELEDAAIALADILDMRAETDGQAEGWVVESTTNKGGRIATVLVRRGTIVRGDVLVAGLTWAKVRSLRNEAGAQVNVAGPGTPVEIDGWKDQPAAGDEVLQAPDEKTARSVVERRNEIQKSSQMAADMVAVNEARRLEQEKRELEKLKAKEAEAAEAAKAAAARDGKPFTSAFKAPAPASVPEPEPLQTGAKEVHFIIKADVSGSVEAVLNSISALGNSEVCAHILRSGVGPVTEFDVDHAAVAKGHIICFNVAIEPKTAHMAEAAGLKILDHRIIYNLVDDVKAMLSEHLKPIVTQNVLGEAEVAQVFEINIRNRVMMPIAGCKVRNGVVNRNKKVRVLREKEVIYDGTLFSFYLPYLSLAPAYEQMMNVGRNY